MSIVICPKCKSPSDDAIQDGGWLVCSICNNRWLPLAATSASIPTAEIPNIGSTPRVQQVMTPTAKDFIARTASGEYLPEEPGTGQANKALTERVDGRQSDLQPTIGREPAASRIPTLDLPRGEMAGHSSPGHQSPVRSAVPVSVPVRKPKASHNPETGPTIDSDLFDRLEEEARYKRSEMKTVPELTYSDPDKFRTSVPHSDHSAKVICPVCGHSYGSQGSCHTCPQCGTAYDTDSRRIAAGTKDNLIGRNLRGCLIDRKLGEGGMGAVYHAKQLSLDRSVAVKVLPVDLARNKNFIQRFEREAKSLARINHPNILQIYDFGEDPQLGLYFMIIEFVEGLDLGEVLNRRGLLDQIQVLDLLRQAVSGLEAATEKGVIHRDIKPDNLMIGANGVVKVSDFGLAKGYVAQVGVTAAGVRVGTPAFMSPEQCDGVEVDYRSDIYNLGATAFLCLTGRLPFDGETPFAIMLKHKTEAVPSLCEIDPTIDRRVDRLISQLLSKRREQRCDSLRELLETIESIEAQLAGTDSVLRKSHGPFRAMLSGEPPIPMVASQDGSPVESPSMLPVLDQVELADLPPAPPLPAAVASRGQVSGARSQGSNSSNLRRSIDLSATLPPASLEIAAPPIFGKGPQRTNHRLDVELQQARERGRRTQLNMVINNADRLAEDGSFIEAAEAWTAAAELVGADDDLRKDLLKRARGARRRSGARRFLHAFLTLSLILAVMTATIWLSTPALHNWLVSQRLQVLTDGFANVTPRQQITELRGFAANNNAPWYWYVTAFRNSYVVGASDEAIKLAENLENQPLQPDNLTGEKTGSGLEIATVLALVQDPQATWETVAQQARNLLTAAQQQDRDPKQFAPVSEALLLAENELALQADDLQKIAAARAAGDHAGALRLAQAFRARHVRATASFTQLPLPARIRIEVTALELPATLALHVDDIAVAVQAAVPGASGASAAEALFCRNGDRETIIEVQAEGFTTQRQTIPGSTSSIERALSMSLRPAAAWSINFANPATNATFVTWARLHPLSNGNLVLHHREGVLVLRQADGAVLVSSKPRPNAPGFGQMWFPIDDNRMLMALEDGTVELTRWATLIPEQILHRGRGEVLAWTDLDLMMQNGKQIHAIIERSGTGIALVAQDPGREYWRYANLKVANQTPVMVRHDDRLYVFDDVNLHLLEEDGDGTVVRVFNLQAARSGMPVELALNGNRELLVPTTAGVQRLQLGNHQAPVQVTADPVLTGLGAVQLVIDKDQLLAVSDRHVTLLACKPASTIIWQQEQSRPLGALPTLGSSQVITIDDQGQITVRDRASGTPVQRFAHGTPICGPAVFIALAQGPALMVADRAGKAAAYPLRPRPR